MLKSVFGQQDYHAFALGFLVCFYYKHM